MLGDDGKLYPTQTEELVQRMRRLAGKADIITPNYTEVCFLLDTPYEETVTFKQAKEYLKALSALGDKKNKNKYRNHHFRSLRGGQYPRVRL